MTTLKMTSVLALVGATVASMAPNAVRADAECGNVSVDAVGVTGGDVRVTVSGNVAGYHLGICSLVNTVNGITPEACRAMHSTLLAAKLSGRKIQFTIKAVTSCGLTYNPWNQLPLSYIVLL
jgi:hypothetical protein